MRRSRSRDELEELDLPRYGPAIERSELFPNRTNVSFWRRTGDAAIRARIFERGVGETMSSGTGATAPPSPPCCAEWTARSPSRLDGGELEVEVGEDLRVDLTGWARARVRRNALSDEFLKELHATE